LIAKHNLQAQNILLPIGNLADNSIQNRLSPANEVTRINIYHTTKPANAKQKIMDQVANDNYDLIVFTSPSTFNNFCYFYGTTNLTKLKIASIGTTTTSAIQAMGVAPLITAEKSNAAGLYQAIIEYYKKN
jgi:uroporphyrinogen-III synthase